ncbi:hypothetical protein SPI_01242 [Niveomyces insectorum RCEF 264]|uniref:Uncharacterized protein n=1 Tax=Niveomyces insectorum RCEF 264 TaxID=1081102 RepID=A0A167YTH5_9HYPO|nr:hypothetical protein SPI_01242 [Niveomyces insectorum RCEF 264]
MPESQSDVQGDVSKVEFRMNVSDCISKSHSVTHNRLMTRRFIIDIYRSISRWHREAHLVSDADTELPVTMIHPYIRFVAFGLRRQYLE